MDFAMKCTTCGSEYGMTHNCAGARREFVLPVDTPEPEPPSSAPAGLSPIHYLLESLRIATWNGEAILRTSRDPRSLGYGIAVCISANSVSAVLNWLFISNEHSPVIDILVRLIFALTITAVQSLAQIGTCFLVAKWFLGGEGRFIQILRPLLLGSIVFLLAAIPYAGTYLAAIAWVCVFAMVFQVVADIESFSAYAIAIVIGLVFSELGSYFSHTLR